MRTSAYDESEIVALLSRLVACPSVSPTDGDGAKDICGEATMVELLEQVVRPWGADTRRTEFAPGRFNFVATFPGRDAGRNLMLEAHSDTVSAEGMTIDPFKPVVRDGWLFGRGACDNKGPMAAMLLGIRAVLDECGQLPITVHFVATGDEEIDAGGAKALLAEGFRPDAAIVAEPTDLKIAYAHKGALRFAVTTRGRAAHSSSPERGLNAIEKMAKVVLLIQTTLAEKLAESPHSVLGPATLNVGAIKGGSGANVVPDCCRIVVDRRTLPGENSDDIIAEISRQLDALKAADPQLDTRLEQMQYYPPLEHDRQSPPAQLLEPACRTILGADRYEWTAVHYATTAGFFRQAGIPSLVFGPGSITRAHTADESIKLQDIALAAKVYAEVIRNAGGKDFCPRETV